MGNYQEKGQKEIDVAAVWKRETKLTTEQRRKRYKCGDRFITLASIPVWSQEVFSVIESSKSH